MARLFNTTSDYATGGTGAIPTTGSLAFWCYPTWAQADGVTHSWFHETTAGNEFNFFKFSNNSLYCGWYPAAEHRVVVLDANYTLNQNAWNHFCLTWANSGTATLYLNATSIGTRSTISTYTGSGTWHVGAYSGPLFTANSRMAELGMWNAVLDPAEVDALADGYSPAFIRPASRINYWDILGRNSPEIPLSGTQALSIVGTPAQAEHPRMIYRSRAHIVTAPPAAGGARPRLVGGRLVNNSLLLTGLAA